MQAGTLYMDCLLHRCISDEVSLLLSRSWISITQWLAMTTFFFVELQSHSIACLLYMWFAGTHRLGLAWLYSFVGDHHMAMEAGEE
ncbi:hypothetical protein B296_00007370 [Ensete ventricosum]|uniref:Uncharacterized protein n=1 Tax=Ensete ventricosum TaxID=4639 RepID=A0A427B902_ENSVE|nr:hypothetical protein B296_00007370 [Ensete ventricosum]